jgi:hypothetical protein
VNHCMVRWGWRSRRFGVISSGGRPRGPPLRRGGRVVW